MGWGHASANVTRWQCGKPPGAICFSEEVRQEVFPKLLKLCWGRIHFHSNWGENTQKKCTVLAYNLPQTCASLFESSSCASLFSAQTLSLYFRLSVYHKRHVWNDALITIIITGMPTHTHASTCVSTCVRALTRQTAALNTSFSPMSYLCTCPHCDNRPFDAGGATVTLFSKDSACQSLN